MDQKINVGQIPKITLKSILYYFILIVFNSDFIYTKIVVCIVNANIFLSIQTII